ncbi:glycosyltransferase family 39 protein [Halomicroarcula sp. GCM10025709]|uniref:glycosyltransferase family 39 protein n=1 Tax=Halomicroarcula sp. GCM10025709 TaxID=3252669 RepID=UPI00360A6C44
MATGTLAGLYHTTREAFDARTGVVASVLLLASPLFLVNAAVFLSYVPATFWNLAFAASYLRADRTGSRPLAALAGACAGIAFFTRPYTAVLFATPFICHALWSCRRLRRAPLERVGLTAVFGTAGVLLALGYNTLTTGDPLVFPYQAFAPNDGLGFGRRSILAYSREFTPHSPCGPTGNSSGNSPRSGWSPGRSGPSPRRWGWPSRAAVGSTVGRRRSRGCS